jgi:hypothetical protein
MRQMPLIFQTPTARPGSLHAVGLGMNAPSLLGMHKTGVGCCVMACMGM